MMTRLHVLGQALGICAEEEAGCAGEAAWVCVCWVCVLSVCV